MKNIKLFVMGAGGAMLCIVGILGVVFGLLYFFAFLFGNEMAATFAVLLLLVGTIGGIGAVIVGKAS